ncbi:MAG: YdeI/OmpD-associated family protein [Aridibacter famidurans]|nr:YdeI/OmpD-associated family protein [Aridibacter famidurans]
MACGEYTKEIDNYIAKSEDFAKPILEKLRKVVHETCPDVEEKMRWSFPHFDHKGMMISMASFKNHCSFGFWKQSIMADPDGIFSAPDEGMGSLGKIESIKDLPSEKVLKKYIKEAVRLNDEGIKVPKKPSGKAKALAVPAYLTEALKKNKKAQKTFEGFSTSHRNEYVEWITDAKQEKTRERRIAQALEWMSEGKGRNWKYER